MLFIIAVHNYTIAMNCCQGYYLSIYNVTANALTYFSIMEENYFVIWTLQFLNFFAFPAQRDELLRLWESERRYFNPLSLHSERPVATVQSGDTVKFQTTLPAKGETWIGFFGLALLAFQPTLPAKGETKDNANSQEALQFQPNLPAKGETTFDGTFNTLVLFQPNLPAKGETISSLQLQRARIYFNPLSQQRERPRIHLPDSDTTVFQPTLPAKGETNKDPDRPAAGAISTHSPSKGRDARPAFETLTQFYFNPLSQQRERR